MKIVELKFPISQLVGIANHPEKLMKYGRPTFTFNDALSLTYNEFLDKFKKRFGRYDGDHYEYSIVGDDFVVKFNLDKVVEIPKMEV